MRGRRWPGPGKGPETATIDPAEETTHDQTVGASGDSADAIAVEGTDAAVCTSTEESSKESTPERVKRHVNWSRIFVYGLLPALALLLALAAGYLKWVDNSARTADQAGRESVQAAKDSTVAMLSYKPDTVERQLNDARGLLAGDFKESYTGLINDVVIPGAKQKQISAVASVPAVVSVTADANKAVVLVFVDQTTTIGQSAPTDTASSVRVTLEKIDGRWLITKFDPI
ncbi:hypothetical protein [Mycobacterium sp. MMS18-G62]